MDDNVVNLPLGINEPERIFKIMIDAVGAYYRAQGKVDEKGRADIPPRTMLRALAALTGEVLYGAPDDVKREELATFMADAAEHAGMPK